MERELPIINLEGTDFIVDVSKFELREKEDPANIITLQDMIDVGEGYAYGHLEIPEFVRMDPEGMASKYKVDDITGKTDFDLMVDQEAFDKRVNHGLLPILDISGHSFYVDIRMDMLRPHDDFLSKGIVFDEIDNYFSEEENAYIIPYNPKTHEFQELDYENITEFPKDLIAVQFPFQKELDPIGWNRAGGWDIKDDLKLIGVKSHFEAKTVPWQKTWLPYVINDNLKRQKQEDKKKPTVKPVQQKDQKRKGRKM